MRLDLSSYNTLVFDCDGVLLNSNKVKTQAFYLAALPYGDAAAQALVDYHVANGGVSRYKKFDYFLKSIVADQSDGPGVDVLLSRYAENVREGLLSCDVASGLMELRTKTNVARWLIVSGGDQAELREIFQLRGLANLFDGGIFGSPDTKDEILEREKVSGNIKFPAMFLGDSKYDYQASHAAGLDFIFVADWSEVKDPGQWCQENSLCEVRSISQLI